VPSTNHVTTVRQEAPLSDHT